MILDDSFPTTCASCHDCWGYRNATLRVTTWSECRWRATDIPRTRWLPQRERVADSSLHRAPLHPTTTRRKKDGAYFLTTTTAVQCMRQSPSSAERIWDAVTLFWEGRIAQRRWRSSSTGDGESARDVGSLTTVRCLFCVVHAGQVHPSSFASWYNESNTRVTPFLSRRDFLSEAGEVGSPFAVYR